MVGCGELYIYLQKIGFLSPFCVLLILFQAKRENTQPCFPCSGSGARKSFTSFSAIVLPYDAQNKTSKRQTLKLDLCVLLH